MMDNNNFQKLKYTSIFELKPSHDPKIDFKNYPSY